jgi:hypothetical protein
LKKEAKTSGPFEIINQVIIDQHTPATNGSFQEQQNQ